MFHRNSFLHAIALTILAVILTGAYYVYSILEPFIGRAVQKYFVQAFLFRKIIRLFRGIHFFENHFLPPDVRYIAQGAKKNQGGLILENIHPCIEM